MDDLTPESVRFDGDPRSVSPQSTSTTPENGRFYLPQLDGLRFFAFLAVFLSHVATFSAAQPVVIVLCNLLGRFGVDLFFALSAYLLTMLMIREMESFGNLNVGFFYLRRILRIWPLYFSWLFVLIVTRRLWSDYQLGFFVPFLFFVANFQAFLGVVANLVILPPWSLSVEEQFYLIFPLLARNLTRKRIAIAGGVVWILSIGIRFVLLCHRFTPHQLWFSGFARLGSFAAGILVAATMRQPLRCSGRTLVIFGLICWAQAGTCHLYRFYPEGVTPMFGFLLGAIGAAVFLIAAIGASESFMLTNAVSVYLGCISYGLYVFHCAGLVVASHIASAVPTVRFWPSLVIVGFALTLMVSAASYQWLELPFLRLKQSYGRIDSAPAIRIAEPSSA